MTSRKSEDQAKYAVPLVVVISPTDLERTPVTSSTRSETTTTATTLPASRVGGSGGDILNAADLHASTGKGAESGLSTGTGGLGAVTTGGPDLDVEGSDAELLAADSDVLGGQHGSVGGGLVTARIQISPMLLPSANMVDLLSLDLHATSDTGDGFTTREISDVDEGLEIRLVKQPLDVISSPSPKSSVHRVVLCPHSSAALSFVET